MNLFNFWISHVCDIRQWKEHKQIKPLYSWIKWICTFVLGRKCGNTMYYITKMQHEWFFIRITSLISLVFVGINMQLYIFGFTHTIWTCWQHQKDRSTDKHSILVIYIYMRTNTKNKHKKSSVKYWQQRWQQFTVIIQYEHSDIAL